MGNTCGLAAHFRSENDTPVMVALNDSSPFESNPLGEPASPSRPSHVTASVQSAPIVQTV